MKYFYNSFLVTFLGLIAGAWLGWDQSGTLAGVLTTVFIVAVLGVLEVSLSFDNAVVNATVLEHMDPVWQRRFITWGIAIAVFGMRIVFPVVIVAIIARIGPIDAVMMAATDPDEYSRVLTSAHVSVSAFGGSFLAMVGLKHFFDAEKEVHWISVIERPLTRLGRIASVELGLCMLLLWAIGRELPEHEQMTFMVSGIFGLLTYIAVDGLSAILDAESAATADVAVRSGFASFMYLEVLDASFSFDGVIGAFALSNNLFIIAIGLGIGAMFVRSLTIMLVNKGTLTQYRYLEHGAFYAIIALGVIMFLKTLMHIPEAITGLIGASFIGLAFWDSVRHNRRQARSQLGI
ncbi:MAG TPA: DUF475 domain-containing protein [Candidatus Limnocylindrales bacterium]|nr:DUF475 domain-containing protein [Candidatus Limnocylindrales bacterium]